MGMTLHEVGRHWGERPGYIAAIALGTSYKRVKGSLPALPKPIKKPDGADLLALQLKGAGGFIAQFQREYRFHPPRRFRLDFAWITPRPTPLAVEVNGGIWVGGRHTRGPGATSDAVKSALLAIDGWRLMTVTTDHVRSGQALAWITQALA